LQAAATEASAPATALPATPVATPTEVGPMTRLLTAVLIVQVALPGYGISESAVAQSDEVLDRYDFNGDGDVTCQDDFEIEFPRTHTDEATDAMRQFPEELDDLDNNNDGFACDNQPDPVSVPPVGSSSAPSAPPSRPSTAGCVIVAEVAHASACAGGEARIGLDADEDTLPTATSNGISTEGLLPIFTQHTAEQGTRLVESEQQAERKAKKRKLRTTQRLKQRQLERERQR
jgi:hypothetical protein